MTSSLKSVVSLSIAIMFGHPAIGAPQGKNASWLDETKPASWNTPDASIPDAPTAQQAVDSRCRQSARPPQLDEDQRVRDKGWDLVGAFQGGWGMLVIGGTAGYDGMCRPRQYQDFVFMRGAFVGTLSPQPMDSRTDGALERVSVQSAVRLIAEYARYTEKDALCCPSRTTSVVFDMISDGRVLQPLSTSTSKREASR